VKRLFSLFLMFLFGVSLLQAQDMSELKSKVQKLNDEFAERMVAGDMESMWDGYADDVISMPSYEPMLKGKDACIESSKQMMGSGMKFTEFKTTVTDVMKYDNLVVDIGTYELKMTMPGMADPINDHGKYLTLWEMQKDGSMKVKVETWNTDVNPMQMMGDHGNDMGKPGKEGMMEKKQ
jgi:ketosteroid isomerase-like protein